MCGFVWRAAKSSVATRHREGAAGHVQAMAEEHPQSRLLHHPQVSPYLLHSRKSSVNTTTTAASNTTYGLLDYYTATDNETEQEQEQEHGDSYADTDERSHPFLNSPSGHTPLHRNNTNTSNITSQIRDILNDPNKIKEEDEGDESGTGDTGASGEGGSTKPRQEYGGNLSSPPSEQSSVHQPLMLHTNMSSSHITKHETPADIKESRIQFEKFKDRLNDTMTIKEVSSSSAFSSNFRNKNSFLKKSIKNSEFDRYGFKKTNSYISSKDYNDWWNEYCPYLIRRKSKWVKFLEKNGLYLSSKNQIPSRFPTKSEEMSKFVKKGIPAEWRGVAWFNFVNGNDRLKENVGLYDELVNQSLDLVNENTDAIEKDLHRTFPENVYFKNDKHNTVPKNNSICPESPMLNTLRRVLKCFSLYKPKIGYCQSLNFITGLLLLFMDEEKAFWMLVIITEKFLPGVHESNLEGLAVNQGMLLLCLKQHLPDVWKIIMKNDNDDDSLIDSFNNDDTSYLFFLPTLTFCTTSWFMSLFIGVLPIETTLRIWDIIFYENSKTIFQIALGIFKMLDPELRRLYCHAHGLSNNIMSNSLNIHSDSDLSLNNAKSTSNSLHDYNKDLLSSELFQLIQNTPKRIVNVNLFLDECFKYDSSSFCNLTQSEIKRCREFVISARERHSNLIEKRKELGMSQEERNELLKQEKELSMNGLGLNSVWQSGSAHQSNSKLTRKKSSTASLHSNYTHDMNNLGKTSRGLKTAYWNVGLNRRIKKIYSKGPDNHSTTGF